MPSDTELLEHLYDRFNARDMEAVLATMHLDVMWANGMEGGHVHGHDGVRNYWTRQWAIIDPLWSRPTSQPGRMERPMSRCTRPCAISRVACCRTRRSAIFSE